MASSDRETSTEWQYEPASSDGDDDMDFEVRLSRLTAIGCSAADDVTWLQLATEESQTPSAYSLGDEVSEEGEGETTLYFDAEEGTFVDANGEEVRVEMEDDGEEVEIDDEEEEEEEDEDGGEEGGSRTPHAQGAQTAAASASQPQAEQRQTITSMSP